MTDTHGAVWWTELMTRDIEGAKAYYSTVCGWDWERTPMPDAESGYYWLGMRGGRPLVGMMDVTGTPGMDHVPPHWFSYFAVDDVDAAVAATRAAGGSVIREPFEVPGTGRIAILEDPTGAAMGLMTPAPQP
jgi:predicted enzyme related to lactoylglutathione lyase